MNLDNIGPATKTVPLGRGSVEVSGISLRNLRELISVYPQLVSFVAGGRVDIARLLFDGPEIALAIFAYSEPRPVRRRFWQRLVDADEGLIAAFDKVSAGHQLGALAVIVDLTFKGGERALPFLKSVLAAPPPEKEAEPETPSDSSPEQSSDSSA